MPEEPMVDFTKIEEILNGDNAKMQEFCMVATKSFAEFKQHFGKCMQNRNLEGLRQAGHKIKPTAQMMQLHPLIDQYKQGKKLLHTSASNQQIRSCIEKQQAICSQIRDDLNTY